MRKTNMKSGFTMIELIFVIVVLGILAAVAMPKFVNVQDDAKVSSEKSTIGAIRSSIGMLHGKAIIKNGDFLVKITGATATPATETLVVATTDELYPASLSITSTIANASKDTVVASTDAKITGAAYYTSALESNGATAFGTENGAATLAVVLDLEGRTDWKTGQTYAGVAAGTAGAYSSGDAYMKQTIEGPASQATGVKDDNTIDEFEVDSDGVWQYDAISGTIVYRIDADGAGTAADYQTATN